MRAAGGRTANQQRQLEPLPLHLPRHVHHLVERRRNQPAQTDDVCPYFARALQNPLRENHHAQVDNLVVVAGQHHAHDVFADVVHVALHRREHNLALRAHHLARRDHLRLLRLHEWRQVRDSLLHHARRLDHLRQKHFARAEQVAHHPHARHQRSFNHAQRPSQLFSRLFRVGFDVGVDSLHHRVAQALFYGAAAPLFGLFLRLLARVAGALRLQRLAKHHQPLGRIGPPVQQHIFHQFLQLRIDLLIHFQHAGIHDAHVEPGSRWRDTETPCASPRAPCCCRGS